jgi:hypothetical protein
MTVQYTSAKYTLHPDNPPLCACRRDLMFHEHRHPKKHSRILAVTATCQNDLCSYSEHPFIGYDLPDLLARIKTVLNQK